MYHVWPGWNAPAPLLRFTKLFVRCLKGGVLSCLGHAARHKSRLQRASVAVRSSAWSSSGLPADCAVCCAVVRSCGLVLVRPVRWIARSQLFNIYQYIGRISALKIWQQRLDNDTSRVIPRKCNYIILYIILEYHLRSTYDFLYSSYSTKNIY